MSVNYMKAVKQALWDKIWPRFVDVGQGVEDQASKTEYWLTADMRPRPGTLVLKDPRAASNHLRLV